MAAYGVPKCGEFRGVVCRSFDYGTTVNATVASGGLALARGGAASGTVVSLGGTLHVSSGSVASGGVVKGSEMVFSAGSGRSEERRGGKERRAGAGGGAEGEK